MSPLTLPLQWALYAVLAVVLVAVYGLTRSSKRARALPLPPGPRPLPIIGNMLDVPTKDLGRSFRKISEKYGDIAYLNVLGQPMVVLGSYEAASAILDVHSATTSGRQSSIMAELTGYASWEFALFNYGPKWRRYRRIFHEAFHRKAIGGYHPILLNQTKHFLRRLLEDPDEFVAHIRHFFGATIMRLVYGLDVAEQNDKHISLVERGVDIFIKIMIPGRYLVEAIPVLRHFPTWFPGASFKRDASAWKEEVLALRDEPFRATQEQIAKESYSTPSSMVSRKLEKAGKMADPAATEEREVCRNVAAIAYLTGADTTFSSVQAFLLAMAMYPNVQRRAQAELDRVVGSRRLPDFSDRPNLPYVEAVVKECLRWHNVATLGVPHLSSEDIELNGYLIPKGTSLIPNAWAMSRDPVAYPDPDEFKPERFLVEGKPSPNVRDPRKYFFGFGRRICAGRHLADASLFIIVASVLHTLDIAPPLDSRGNPVQLEAKMNMDLFLSYPERFECRITPRSTSAKELILSG